MFKHARSSCPPQACLPYEERVETNGDGVKPGSTSPMGHGAQMSNEGHVLSLIGHFCPVPICFGVIRELKQHSLEVCGVFKYTRSKCASYSESVKLADVP